MGRRFARAAGRRICGLHRRAHGRRSGNGAFASFSEIRNLPTSCSTFSFHTATESALGFALEHGLPIVIGTTGHAAGARAHRARLRACPRLFSGNMSLGIAALCGLVRGAARLFPEAEIEIVETHHSRKADAPSGTAAYARCRRSKKSGRRQRLCAAAAAFHRENPARSAYPPSASAV